MNFIEPHAHMVTRTTDDYMALATAGCLAVCEPAFWAGFDRSSPQGFYDYFMQLTVYEPKRAAQFGIKHFSWLCINPKEAEDVVFAREVMSLIPEFLKKPQVLGIGEIGLNRNTRNELQIFEEHVDLAIKHNQLVLIHTPHLEDKLKGTKLILDVLKNRPELNPSRVIVDHTEEHSVGLVLDAGYWAGMTLYPVTKCTSDRAIDILETFGTERVWMNSACDWGCSDPLSIPKTAVQMQRRGHSLATRRKILWDNPTLFLSQSENFIL